MSTLNGCSLSSVSSMKQLATHLDRIEEALHG
jgi:hypothetical protein